MQMIQANGLSAKDFTSSITAITSFKNAVSSSMTGVTPDSIYISSVTTMTMKRRRLGLRSESFESVPTYTLEAVTEEPTFEPTEDPTPAPSPPPQPVYQLRLDDDTPPAPTYAPSFKPTQEPTLDTAGMVTGIAITYNITINAKSLGFSAPQDAFDLLSAELITAIDNGNFTAALRNEAKLLGVSTLESAGSSITDFTIRNFLTVGSGSSSGRSRTVLPTGSPTSMPSNPTSAPTKQSEAIIPGSILGNSYEIVAGIVLTAILLAGAYGLSICLSCIREASRETVKVIMEDEKKKLNEGMNHVIEALQDKSMPPSMLGGFGETALLNYIKSFSNAPGGTRIKKKPEEGLSKARLKVFKGDEKSVASDESGSTLFPREFVESEMDEESVHSADSDFSRVSKASTVRSINIDDFRPNGPLGKLAPSKSKFSVSRENLEEFSPYKGKKDYYFK